MSETIAFKPESLQQVHKIMARYPEGRQKSALLPVLHIAQKEFGGWLDVPVMDYVASVTIPFENYSWVIKIQAAEIGTTGDTYDRFMVRQQEIWESIKIIKKAYENLPEGPFHADVPDFYLPEKADVYQKMEALIYHFKIVMGETDVPKGEVYHAVEGGNGELGFYLVSDGGRTPYRLHFRRPCFIYYQAYPEMITGSVISDAIVTMCSMNIIAGELDA